MDQPCSIVIEDILLTVDHLGAVGTTDVVNRAFIVLRLGRVAHAAAGDLFLD